MKAVSRAQVPQREGVRHHPYQRPPLARRHTDTYEPFNRQKGGHTRPQMRRAHSAPKIMTAKARATAPLDTQVESDEVSAADAALLGAEAGSRAKRFAIRVLDATLRFAEFMIGLLFSVAVDRAGQHFHMPVPSDVSTMAGA